MYKCTAIILEPRSEDRSKTKSGRPEPVSTHSNWADPSQYLLVVKETLNRQINFFDPFSEIYNTRSTIYVKTNPSLFSSLRPVAEIDIDLRQPCSPPSPPLAAVKPGRWANPRPPPPPAVGYPKSWPSHPSYCWRMRFLSPPSSISYRVRFFLGSN